MEIIQPLDVLMNRLGLSNADLVNASTEQLSFKMVQKGRKGRRLTPNIQDKILTALLKIKPELQIRRRELFHYPFSEEAVSQIHHALEQARLRKVSYPGLVDLLFAAGVHYYAVDVAAGRVVFYGFGGDAHLEQMPSLSGKPGSYDEIAVKTAIVDAQKGVIDHPGFLKRIYSAGITHYEVNIRNREIRYKSAEKTYKEDIPQAGEVPVQTPLISEEPKKRVKKDRSAVKPRKKPKAVKPTLTKKQAAAKKNVAKRRLLRRGKKTWKPVKRHRVKKR